MWDLIVRCLFLLITLTPSFSITSTTNSPIVTLNNAPFIRHILVFSPTLETVITFLPKHGWMLNDEKSFRLYISGYHLQNSSIAFTTTLNECTPSEYVSPIYPLSSASINEILVDLDPPTKTHVSVYLCLIPPPSKNSSVFSNDTQEQIGEQQDGPYFTFFREKARLPFAAKICLILTLFIVSGFFSGLNLGLMSLSVNDLRLISESEDPSLRYYARRVLPLRRRGNFLLCSIVLANVLVNSLGTVLLDSLVHGLFAVIGSTIMIVLMGEIIPQAICSRYGLIIGAHTHVITWTCMILTSLISYPLGFILDKILGQEVTASYTRDQIANMLTRISADIEKPELDVITGVLSLRKKTVKEAMTWLPDVYMLDKDRKTDAELLLEVHKHGFSRIPVYSNEKSNVIGIVKLRDFALITPEQYHLTVKNLMEFHTHPYGYAKTTESLYNLMQEFLKSRWHIALVQELRNEEDNVDPVFATVGVITLEDVIEEMLQREIIEEADFFTDNRRKIQRKRAKTTDYTALVKRPVKGPSISPQLKVAVFQYLSTNIQQFTSGFISHEILKILLNYNIYANIKRHANQTNNSIYLYKKGFRYELFTLVMQGNATLESGAERIISTVGPFSFFAASALLAENKTVKDVHLFLDRLFTINAKSNHITQLLDEISSIFVPDYNLIVNTELQVLQIHRLVWLAAVRATQRQRGNDPYYRRMQPEQLLSNALDEISSVTNVPIDKTNLTNFQRIFLHEKDVEHSANGNPFETAHSSRSVFEVIHELGSGDLISVNTAETLKSTNPVREADLLQPFAASIPIVCNPLLLTIPSYDQTAGNAYSAGTNQCSSASNSLYGGEFNSSMHINRMFDEGHDHTGSGTHETDGEHLIDHPRHDDSPNDLWERATVSTTTSIFPTRLPHANSQPDLSVQITVPIQVSSSSSSLDENPNRTNRRSHSLLGVNKCTAS